MEGKVLVFAQVMAVIATSTAVFVAIGVAAYRFVHAASRVRPKAVLTADNTRLERLEAAVDAIAIEVERISESQRFTVGLLSERLPPRSGDRVGELPGPSGTKRVNT